MALEQNVTSVLVSGNDYNEILENGLNILKEKEYLKTNDTVVLSGNLSKKNTGTIIRI